MKKLPRMTLLKSSVILTGYFRITFLNTPLAFEVKSSKISSLSCKFKGDSITMSSHNNNSPIPNPYLHVQIWISTFRKVDIPIPQPATTKSTNNQRVIQLIIEGNFSYRLQQTQIPGNRKKIEQTRPKVCPPQIIKRQYDNS